MVDIEIIDTGASRAGPYSLGIKAGNLLFISGQVTTPDARDIKAQTLAALEKIKNVLQAAGASVSNIVKVTVFLKNIFDFKEMNEAYADFF
ncbi:2-iminobutanoate/2-iminopropanoate deaminase [subsurface metagenome]